MQECLKNHYVFHQHRSKSSTFDENPCRFLRKTHFFHWIDVLYEKCFTKRKTSNVFQKTRARTQVHSGPLDFLEFSILRYVCVFCVGLGTFSVILLHFPQKYRCVPKIGFPARILMNICIFLLFSSGVSLCT